MATETARLTVTGFPSCARVVTPHNDNDLADFNGNTVAMHVRAETAGTIAVIPAGNQVADTVTFTLAAGEFVPCRVRRVLVTGTSAATITGVW
jgi:hypothetical protein